jgi:ABC-type nitrate/sulfonate/bicarbonate transport system substrate-binding protein
MSGLLSVRIGGLAAAAWLGLAACGGGAAPAAPPASPAARPSVPVSASPSAGGLERTQITVTHSQAGGVSMPEELARDAGYYAKHGIDLKINVVSSSAGIQSLISGTVDIYQGGTAAIAGHLAGSDIIYMAAPVDKNTQMLFGQKGITTFEALRGKSVATTSPGAFGEIAMRKTAKKYNMEIGKDIKLLYHPSSAASLATFESGQADGLIVTPPGTLKAQKAGYPVIVDFKKENLKIIGPGMALTRQLYQQNPNALKAYLEGYLDGLKRVVDDPAYAKEINGKYLKITDQALLDEDYQENIQVWNRDLTVEPSAIQNVLDASDDPKAKTASPKDFYDNSLIQQVNRDYGSKLFPNEVKA